MTMKNNEYIIETEQQSSLFGKSVYYYEENIDMTLIIQSATRYPTLDEALKKCRELNKSRLGAVHYRVARYEYALEREAKNV